MTTSFVHETLDDLVDTQFYKQGLKAATTKMQNELKKICTNYRSL